jgi:hypothetical protein
MAQPWKLRGYVVERLLGVGGTGEVWRARVAATGEPVALKRLGEVDAQSLRRMRSEAAMLSALEHPNLIRLHGVVEDDDCYVLVLDLAEGGSLSNLLAARGRITPGEAVTALAPVAAALAYAHAQGVVHGDVSPANVLFTAAGVPLLADLGVARLCGDDVEAESTAAYLDAAVALGCVPSPSSDVFMLGGVALHALTGRPPWPGATAAEHVCAARAGVLEDLDLRLRAAQVPDAMAEVVLRALSGDALLRGSAADFALDLRQSAKPVAVQLHAGGGVPSNRSAVVRGARDAATKERRGGRHAAVALADRDSRDRVPWRARTDGDPPPTTSVGPRPRPKLPPRRRTAPWGRHGGASVAVLAAVALIVAAAFWVKSRALWDHGRRVAPSATRTPVTRTPASAVSARPDLETTDVPPGLPAGRGAPTRPPPGSVADGWRRILEGLDARRARAFARRSVAVLRSVYASSDLLRADSRTLTHLVPPGCRLVGARTAFSHVVARARGPATVFSVRAALRPSTLRCPGRADRAVPGTAPVPLRVVLVRTRHGPRISREWRPG